MITLDPQLPTVGDIYYDKRAYTDYVSVSWVLQAKDIVNSRVGIVYMYANTVKQEALTLTAFQSRFLRIPDKYQTKE